MGLLNILKANRLIKGSLWIKTFKTPFKVDLESHSFAEYITERAVGYIGLTIIIKESVL